jgi:hypothetical protein
MVATMVQNARENDTLKDWLISPQVKKQYHAVGVVKGLKMHGHLDYFADNINDYRMGAENKTTKERTIAGFLKSCNTWFYHGQVFIYADLLQLEAFTTFASSKTNGKLLQLDYTPELFAEGEAQFDRLIENLAYYNITQFNV